METIKPVKASLFKYMDLTFLVKFVSLFLILYTGNEFFTGITVPGGRLYSPFLAEYVNYIAWIRTAIIYTANAVAHGLGLHSYMPNSITLQAPNGAFVFMAYECIGMGILSFWTAFVVACSGTWQKKIVWGIGGLLAICLINSVRVAVLLIAMANKWKVNKYMDHHTSFNIIVYALILVMMYWFTKENKRPVAIT